MKNKVEKKKRKLPKIKNYEYFPKVNPAVDIACFNISNTYILLGRKKDEKLLRLIGGFVDPKLDNSYEEAAIREFKEEAGTDLRNVEYICNTKVDDKRFRKADDKIFVTLFYGQVFDNNIKAGDDIEEVRWVELNSLFEERLEDWIVKNHIPLIKKSLEFVTQNKTTNVYY